MKSTSIERGFFSEMEKLAASPSRLARVLEALKSPPPSVFTPGTAKSHMLRSALIPAILGALGGGVAGHAIAGEEGAGLLGSIGAPAAGAGVGALLLGGRAAAGAGIRRLAKGWLG